MMISRICDGPRSYEDTNVRPSYIDVDDDFGPEHTWDAMQGMEPLVSRAVDAVQVRGPSLHLSDRGFSTRVNE